MGLCFYTEKKGYDVSAQQNAPFRQQTGAGRLYCILFSVAFHAAQQLKLADVAGIGECIAGKERTGAPVQAHVRLILLKLILNQVHHMLVICLCHA